MSDGRFEELLAEVRAAGALALSLRQAGLTVERKADGEAVTNADRALSERLLAVLAALYPEDARLSEESPSAQAGAAPPAPSAPTWFLDPIDGTHDYLADRDGFTIMLGRSTGGRPELGIVYRPTHDWMFFARNGQAHLEVGGARSRLCVSTVSAASDARLIASRSHRDDSVSDIKQTLAVRTEHNVGSIGLKLCLIAKGDYDLYVNPTPRCKLWDTCAPEAILCAAGGVLTTLGADTLHYQLDDVALRSGLVATNGHIHEEVIAKLRPLFGRG